MKIENGKAVFENDEEKAAYESLLNNETKGLKEKNGELLGKLKGFDKFKDVDPEEYAKLKEQASKDEEDRAKAAGEWDKLKQQMADAHAKEMKKRDDRIGALEKSLEEQVLVAQATQAIATEKGSPLLLMPHVRSRTKLDESGKPVVVDDAGNIRVDGQGQPMTIQALIAEMKADVATFGRAFDASGASGAGSQSSSGGAQQQPKTSVEKIKAGLEKLAAV